MESTPLHARLVHYRAPHEGAIERCLGLFDVKIISKIKGKRAAIVSALRSFLAIRGVLGGQGVLAVHGKLQRTAKEFLGV
ncbi:hypothetical protein B296_00006182 [Ensete ventricosum]|uniref:Uncharacterized protein n=1 Tax=Ensete ventricosum TaxID=4639 RepID=A0A427AM35_ENSVE|nr:hypothetical protein B296_00006182 [Ensete ventricosum]